MLAVTRPRCLESSVGLSLILQLKDIGKVTQASKTTLSLAYRLGSGPCRERSCISVQRTGSGAWSVSLALYLRALNCRLRSKMNFKLFWFFFKEMITFEVTWKPVAFFFFNSNLFFLFVRECHFYIFMRISTISVSGNGFTPGMWRWFLSHEQK